MLLGALALGAFATARTAVGATLCHCLASATVSVHGSGYAATYREVGGADATLLSSLANTCANIPGFLAPMFSLAMRRWSGGGWGLSFSWPAVTLTVAAIVYGQTASMETARATLLVERSREQQRPSAGAKLPSPSHAPAPAPAKAVPPPAAAAAAAADAADAAEQMMVISAALHNGQSVKLRPMDRRTTTVIDIKQAIADDPSAQDLSALGPFVKAADLHLVADGKRLLDERRLCECGFDSDDSSSSRSRGRGAVEVFVLQEEMLDEDMRKKLQEMPTA
jgi:hypothetical protein